ncbi:MAG: sulfur carrier protein ThiS [Thermodesulfobacteriota bacterium]
MQSTSVCEPSRVFAPSGCGSKDRRLMTNRVIQIIVNGCKENVPENSTISRLIDHFGQRGPDLMVHRNGQYVWQRQYGTTIVEEGDRLDLIHIDFGG